MILILNLLWSEFVETMSDVSICFYRSRLSVTVLCEPVCYYHFRWCPFASCTWQKN